MMTASEIINQYNITTDGTAVWVRIKQDSEECTVLIYRTMDNPIIVRGYKCIKDAYAVTKTINEHVQGVRRLRGVT